MKSFTSSSEAFAGEDTCWFSKSFTSSSETFAGEDTCWVSLGQFCTHFHGSRHTQPLKYISRQNSKLNKVYISYINLINRDKSMFFLSVCIPATKRLNTCIIQYG